MSSALQYLSWIIWAGISILQIVTSSLLIRPRETAPWLMLTGSILGLMTQVAMMWMIFGPSHGRSFNPKISMMLSSCGIFWAMLFGIGLLFVAFKHRRLHTRLEELEGILAAQSNLNATSPQPGIGARPSVF